MIADDSGVMRKIIGRASQKAGFEEMIEALDESEAFEKFEDGQFDLVISDWNMPNKNELELTQEIDLQDSR